MVTLKALEAAITQVEKIRDHEFTFEAGDMNITLRPLRSHEETEVQRYAQVAWEGAGEQGDTAAYQDFMDRVRVATLGCSIIQLGAVDLRGVEWVETGDVDEDGTPFAVPKWEAIRDLISAEWTKALMLQVFGKFGELLERVEISATKLVRFDPADLDEEIERLERRLADLRLKRGDSKAPDQSPVQKAQKAVADVGRRQTQMHNEVRSAVGPTAAAERAQRVQETVFPSDEEGAPEPHDAPPAPPESRPAPQGRRSAIPQEAVPPVRTSMPPEEVGGEEPAPPERAPEEFDEQGIVLPYEGDSFFDPSDPGEALKAESRRQSMLHARNTARANERKAAAKRAEEMGIPTSADLARERLRAQHDQDRPKAVSLDVDPRTAGLRQAANLRDQVMDTGAGRMRTGKPQAPVPQSTGRQTPEQLHGKPVYKMPPQTLDRSQKTRQHGEPPAGPMQVNPPAGGRQAKFRGAGEQ